ncbi:GATOR complex protein NPRL3 [Drosophila grimshawi]|uniref:GATOR complex protein NPRL3 n=1 Tax=Drosophila grimshawi TaxID=7222 RepID=B4IXZ1_DROGR|nr:GATOR complex protein NPRL3 [Drosophila grimshawi]EDV97534.1 GH14646 [Drosophila grimshawi]
MEVNPLAVILVYYDSKGDRLLYRYPYQPLGQTLKLEEPREELNNKKRNPFAVAHTDDLLQTANSQSQSQNHHHQQQQQQQQQGQAQPVQGQGQGQLKGFADHVLSTLFAVKPQLCHQKFELKLNDVRFVSHPTMISVLPGTGTGTGSGSTAAASQTLAAAANSNTTSSSSNTVALGKKQQMVINIVFALHAQASYSIVKCYHELSKRLGLALKFEEQRSGYLTEQLAQMARTHDEQQQEQQPLERILELIAERCSLAQALKSICNDLCTTGLLSTTLNQNLTLTFCLPAKAHQLHKKGSMVDPETIDRCLRALKPYHGMLLLVDFAELLDCVPPTGARMLWQLVDAYNPLISLQSMASNADLSIEHVYKLVSHLVYWAKATIIYPLCETNVYVIAPDAPLHTRSHLVEKFSARFAGLSLFEVICDFSLPTSIGHLTTPLQQPARQGILAQMVLWMLQHHLLMQLHTYVQFMPSDADDEFGDSASCAQASNLTEEEHDQDEDEEEEEEEQQQHQQQPDEDVDQLAHGGGSMLSMSSQPLPVPRNAQRRGLAEDQYSLASDNIVVQPSSSHKSNFSMTASLSTDNCDSLDSIEDEQKLKELLQVFSDADRAAIRRIPASTNVDDLSLLVKLYQMGYFKSEHHLEEIMYFENLRRSQLLQLLDKFRDVLIIYETEDPAIASMYNNK